MEENKKNKVMNDKFNYFAVSCKSEAMLKVWLSMLAPIHKMTTKEISVASLFLKIYFDNKDNIIDDDLLNNVVLNIENKRTVRTQLDLSFPYFQMLLKSLKQKGFIENGKINPRYIPSFTKEGNIVIMSYIANENFKPVK